MYFNPICIFVYICGTPLLKLLWWCVRVLNTHIYTCMHTICILNLFVYLCTSVELHSSADIHLCNSVELWNSSSFKRVWSYYDGVCDGNKHTYTYMQTYICIFVYVCVYLCRYRYMCIYTSVQTHTHGVAAAWKSAADAVTRWRRRRGCLSL